MSDMRQASISECSFTGSESHTLDELIDSTSSKLKAALTDVVTLRKELRELLEMKKEYAINQVSKAKQYFESVEKQENELSGILGDNETGLSLITSLGQDNSSGSSLKSPSDVVHSRQKSDSNHAIGDLTALDDSSRDRPVGLHSIDAGYSPISMNYIGNGIPARNSEINSVRCPEDSNTIRGFDNVTLGERIKYHQEQVRFMEEETRRREEARGQDMQAMADAQLAVLGAERLEILRRQEEIARLEQEAVQQFREGQRLARTRTPTRTPSTGVPWELHD